MNSNQLLTKDARTWAMFSHLSTFSGFIIPFGNIIIPMVIWLSKKEENEFIADQAKEVLNFQISLLVYFVAGIIILIFSIFRNPDAVPWNLIFVIILLGLIWLFDLIVTIVGAVRANDGIRFRYPLNMRFIR